MPTGISARTVLGPSALQLATELPGRASPRIRRNRKQWHTLNMESLALLVGGMYLAEIAFAVTTLIFSIWFHVKRRFGKTSLVLIILLTAETIWALTLLPAFGYPGAVGIIVSALFRFLPNKSYRHQGKSPLGRRNKG